jgi:hypothetical protein
VSSPDYSHLVPHQTLILYTIAFLTWGHQVYQFFYVLVGLSRRKSILLGIVGGLLWQIPSTIFLIFWVIKQLKKLPPETLRALGIHRHESE